MGSTLTSLIIHVIFSTKHRAPIIHDCLQKELFKYMAGIVRREGATMILAGGTADHVHCLVKLKPDQNLSWLMQRLKGGSSKWINGHKKVAGRFSWQSGYAAFSVSQSTTPSVKNYIKQQKKHHAKRSFRDEYLACWESTVSNSTNAIFGINLITVMLGFSWRKISDYEPFVNDLP